MGKAGACFVTAKGVVIARPPEVSVESTVGAGDAMVAGIVMAQLRALPLSSCARMATAFSANAVSRIEPGLTSISAVESLMERVTVEE
jgi:fructose-1-phosphate kinase PfkB-like protein